MFIKNLNMHLYFFIIAKCEKILINLHRFGFGDSSEGAKDPEDEVNEYLMRAIDARSIDHLRAEHCQSLFLSFKDQALEKKVSCVKIKLKDNLRTDVYLGKEKSKNITGWT